MTKSKKSKYTPGPWKWERPWAEDNYSRVHDGDMGGLEPSILWFGMYGDESIYCPNEANARLIAAAPAMFELLDWISGQIGGEIGEKAAGMINKIERVS